MSAAVMEGAKLRCGKCGFGDVMIRWHGNGAYHSSRRGQACWGDYGSDRGKPKSEHLHYHCRTCQFSWTGPLTPPRGGVSPSGKERP
jgi:hypothetical protein